MQYAGRSVREMERARLADIRPVVVLKERVAGYSDLWKITNIGKGAALNTFLRFDEHRVTQQVTQEIQHGLRAASTSRIHLAPGESHELYAVTPCVIIYEDAAHNTFQTIFEDGKNILGPKP